MLNIILLSLSIIVCLGLIGYPLVAIFFYENIKDEKIDRYLVLAFSLVIGFGISAFAASTSFSYFGVNTYFLIMFLILCFSWILYFKNRRKLILQKINKTSSRFLITFIIASLYYTKSQWDRSLNSIIFSGPGPDVPQNLMASLKASELGSNWFSASNKTIADLGVTNSDQAAYSMFEYPSHSSLAVIDYLVFGVRWGLHIPYNQIIRIIGPQGVMFEIGTILFVTLFTICIIVFAVSQLITKSNLISTIFALTVALNGSFLNQYFNGGISQAMGLVGNIGILMVLCLLLTNELNLESRKRKLGLFFLGTCSFLSSSLSYVDGTFGAVLVVTILSVIMLIYNRNTLKSVIKYLVIPGIASLILTPLFAYLVFNNLSGRANAASGTGVATGIWKLPSQFIGLLIPYTSIFETKNSLTFLISVIFSIIIMAIIGYTLLRKNTPQFIFAILAISALIVNLFGFILGYYSRNQSDYIYNKISTYAAPFLLFSILIILFHFSQEKKFKSMPIALIMIISSVVLINSIYIENKFSSSNDTIIKVPNSFRNLLNDKKLYNYLDSNNYIMPYKPAYSFAGLFGVNFWISKAPNDMNLNSRINNPLRLLCFKGDNVCNPKSEPIQNPELEKYGIIEFQSPLSTLEYSKLSIIDRYNYATDSFSQPRVNIPEKFIGGNPYLK
jgi:hypothetical protein